jgi:replicative DNA helicase
MSKEKTPLWTNQREAYRDSLKYLKGRRDGLICSLKTPWSKFNDASTDGLEWHSMTVIGGRPGAGKTLLKDQIIREAFTLNPNEKFRVLEFQLEMVGRTAAIRQYSSVIGRSYKYLCSAEGKISIEDLKTCAAYAKQRLNDPIDIVEDSPTVHDFKSIVISYMDAHVTKDENGKHVYTNTVITLDHSLLLKKASFERDKMETLYSFGEACTELKRKYPIAFIILSQLNRNIDNPDRAEEGKIGNYILSSDIMGADALLQHADLLVGINRPGLMKIRFYGPDRYIIEDDDVLVMHFLKCRNGDTRMSFFKAEFHKMEISELETPPLGEKRFNNYR